MSKAASGMPQTKFGQIVRRRPVSGTSLAALVWSSGATHRFCSATSHILRGSNNCTASVVKYDDRGERHHRRLGVAINERVELQNRHEAGNGQGIHHGPSPDFLDDAKDTGFADEKSTRAAHRRRSAPCQSEHFEQRNRETGGEYQRRQTEQMRSDQIDHAAQHRIRSGPKVDRNRRDGIDICGQIHQARRQQKRHGARVRICSCARLRRRDSADISSVHPLAASPARRPSTSCSVPESSCGRAYQTPDLRLVEGRPRHQ